MACLLSATIGKQFFPVKSESGRLLLALATFARLASSCAPRRRLAWSLWADRRGRKAALTLTIAISGSWHRHDRPSPHPTLRSAIAAPLLYLFWPASLQGLSAGGEMWAATTYLVELAPRGKRGFFGSWQYATQGLASMTAALLGFGLASALSPESMDAWGWRIPFLFGLLIGPVGFYIRRQMNETADPRPTSTRSVLRSLFTNHGRLVVVGILTMFGSSVTAYVTGSYFTTYAIHTLRMGDLPTRHVGECRWRACHPGRLSDRRMASCPTELGARPVMIIPRKCSSSRRILPGLFS